MATLDSVQAKIEAFRDQVNRAWPRNLTAFPTKQANAVVDQALQLGDAMYQTLTTEWGKVNNNRTTYDGWADYMDLLSTQQEHVWKWMSVLRLDKTLISVSLSAGIGKVSVPSFKDHIYHLLEETAASVGVIEAAEEDRSWVGLIISAGQDLLDAVMAMVDFVVAIVKVIPKAISFFGFALGVVTSPITWAVVGGGLILRYMGEEAKKPSK